VAALDEPLMGYRRHGGQTTGAGRRSRGNQVREQLRQGSTPVRETAAARVGQFAGLLERLVERDCVVAPTVDIQLRDALAHQAMRADLPGGTGGRVAAVLREYMRGGYRRWTRGTSTAVIDLLRSSE
jgi:hypothetical protein